MSVSRISSTARRRAILDAFDAVRETSSTQPVERIARRLDISAGELQAARIGRDTWTLSLAPRELARRFEALGAVEARTCSPAATLVQRGRYPRLDGSDAAGLLLAPGGLDLRLLFSHWHWACLVRERPRCGSIDWQVQVFDQHGRMLHSCRALDTALSEGWTKLFEVATEEEPAFTQEMPRPIRELPDTEGLADDWGAMRDVHQFFSLLRRHGLERHEANALMEGHFTEALAPAAVENVLRRASEQRLPLMCFVSSPGCVQIRTGALPLPEWRDGRLSVSDPNFALRLDEAAISRVWRVHKPNADGGVTSLEAFDEQGQMILQLYAERREGQAERADWRRLLEAFPRWEAVA
ncbi:ChuX/HutX family heme-like substrate-binding protein [Halomonas caseinilytica]|uniref:Putative hemin transport protein n=1 Tax=Halomonas caseinilytica TaxID=438744 RepID=A0A1M6NQG5_9GAMM|nr:ChuX/HutX family heme-like substrate-binding protein [Halomonas caseinilytica]SHJ97945.1 putative hemin transport protein [Halomonas caseinilytica]